MATNSKATFESKKIALIGKTQPTVGTENSPDYSNVIIANNLTVKEVITSDSTALSTDNLHRDAVVSITDRYVTTGFDSMIPKLGQHYARRYASNELSTLMVDAKLPANSGFVVSQTGSSLTLSFITKSETRPQEFVDEFLMYVTSGFTNFDLPHATFTGELPLDYSVQQLAGDFADKSGLLFFAKIERQNIVDLSFDPNPTIGVVNALPYVTVKKIDGDAYMGTLLPIAPYFESSNLYQMIYVDKGIKNISQLLLSDVNSLSCNAKTLSKASLNSVKYSLVNLNEMLKFSGQDGMVAKEILTGMQTWLKNHVNSLDMIAIEINTLYSMYIADFATSDYPAMVGNFLENVKWLSMLGGSSGYFSPDAWALDFSGTFYKKDKISFMGKTFEFSSAKNSFEAALAIFNYFTGVTYTDMVVTSDAITANDSDRVCILLAPQNKGRARIVVQTARVSLSDGIVITHPANTGNGSARYCSTISQISTMTNHFDTVMTALDTISCDTGHVTDFNKYRSLAKVYLSEAKKYFLEQLVLSVGNGVNTYNINDLLRQTSQSFLGITVNDLEYCLKKLIFTNESASPDMMTLEARRSSVQLVGEQKTKVSVDNRAIIDVNLEMGKKPMVTFAYEGNLVDTLQKAEMPINLKKQIYSTGDVINASSVRNASLSEQCGTNPVLGCNCESNYNNICMVKASMPNFAGFVRSRTMTTCGTVWTYSSEPWDMTLEIIQRPADTSNADVFNVEDSLGKTFDFVFTQNGSAGETIEIQVSGAVLKGYDDGDSQGLLTHVLQFTVTGFSRIILK